MTFQSYHNFWLQFFDVKIISSLFFVVAGFELSISLIPAIQNSDNNWQLFKTLVGKKYRKIATVLTAFILFNSTFLNRLGGGPFFKLQSVKEFLNCRRNWRLGMLTLNNYVDNREMCMEPTWILSVELHMTIIGFVLLYLLVKFPSWRKVIISLAISVSVLIVSSNTYVNKLNPISMVTPE